MIYIDSSFELYKMPENKHVFCNGKNILSKRIVAYRNTSGSYTYVTLYYCDRCKKYFFQNINDFKNCAIYLNLDRTISSRNIKNNTNTSKLKTKEIKTKKRNYSGIYTSKSNIINPALEYVNFLLGRESSYSSKSNNRVKIDKVSLESKDFLIKDYHFNGENNIKEIIAIIPLVNKYGELIKCEVPAYYSKDKNVYYILSEYFDKVIKNGFPKCKVIEYTKFLSFYNSNNIIGLYNEESLLHAYGYNVSATDNIPISRRQAILKSVIDNNLLTKYEVYDHIKRQIKIRKNSPNMIYAISKWEEDLEYISSLPSKDNNSIYVNSITRTIVINKDKVI